MILSIIIPVYKVEKYITACLMSILPQIRREDVELIIIDDGTPDKSAKIAEELIKGYDNAYIYHQSNEGLSCARNNGLRKATGNYIWFIDSDDSITDNSIDGIIETLKRESPDLLQLSYQKTFEDGREPISCVSQWEGNWSGLEIIERGHLAAPAQFTIYNRKFLLNNSLHFVPGLLHEDSEFKPRATYLAKKISFYPHISYNYLQRESGSIMSSFKYKNANDIIYGINSLLRFSDKFISEARCKIGFRRIIGMNFNTFINGIRNMKKEDREKSLSLLKKNSHILREMIKSQKTKYVIEGIVFSINVRLAIKIYSILK